jgi:flavodoxin/Pyruvate/2-oxoacid:ferredoxin oxidoreductase delta subunit
MKKILILYHSGVGGTKNAAEKIYSHLEEKFDVELFSVEKFPTTNNLSEYYGFVLGFPVIHAHPSKRILLFLHNINKLSEPKPTFIFATCGLYSANALRIFAKHCVKKNFIPITNAIYRAPASDGTLLAPFISRFFTFEKDFNKKVYNDSNDFISKIEKSDYALLMPRFKLLSILNYPNKKIGQFVTFPIFTHKEKCVQCGKCLIHYPGKAFEKVINDYPVFLKKNCEKCYRCIHHCPQKALSLCKKKNN